VEKMARVAAVVPGTVVAAVGGDGTLSRVADALAGTEAILGIIPAGTGNDFARTFGIPDDPIKACTVLLEGQTVAIDAGRLNGRLFLNVVGAGLDAEVVADANRVFKKVSGKLGYLLALLKQLILYRPNSVRISVDNESLQAKVWLVAVANACYYGGGMKVAPNADPQDGLAEIVMVADIHRLTFLRLFPLVYSGKHIAHPAVRVLRGRQVLVECEKPLHVHADGEIYGTTPLSVSVLRHAVKLKVPR
jgi:YegS/Rv2252/BmrU family lipid kinase